MSRYFYITAFFLMPVLIVGYVYYIEFIPSWYRFHNISAAVFSILYVLISWKLIVVIRKAAFSKPLKISLWIAIALFTFSVSALNSYKIVSGHNSYYMILRELQYEYKADSSTTFYVFKNLGFLAGKKKLYVRNSRLPLMHCFYEISSGWVDSIRTREKNVLFYGFEDYPYIKPIIISYGLKSGNFTVEEDTTRFRGISAPPRK